MVFFVCIGKVTSKESIKICFLNGKKAELHKSSSVNKQEQELVKPLVPQGLKAVWFCFLRTIYMTYEIKVSCSAYGTVK